MVIHPSSVEIGTTPEMGVFFYEALEHLDTFTLQLIESYPRIVAESEAARAVDSGDAIRRGVYGGLMSRMFDGSDSEPQPPPTFIPALLEMTKGKIEEIGAGVYGAVVLATRQGGGRTFFARFSEGGTVIFGTSLTVRPEELVGFREAGADDCCQLVNDLASTRVDVAVDS